MEKLLKVALAGILISFIGALPLGSLNITAFDIAASEGAQPAFQFAIAVIVVEVLYVRLSLWGSKRLIIGDQWIRPLLVLGIILLVYLSFSNFMPKPTEVVSNKNLLLFSPIILGLLMSALNPLQFPFWITWNKVLSNKGLLKDTSKLYAFYITGIGLGTFLALSFFIWMGHSLVIDYAVYAKYSGKILGTIYLGFALYLIFQFYRRSFKPITK